MSGEGKWPSTRAELLDALSSPQSNPIAWQQFVESYGPLVYSFCRKRRLQDADAADVTQAVFLSLSRTFPRFRYDPQLGSFRSFLGAVVSNAIRRHYRHSFRQRGIDAIPIDLPDRRALIAGWDKSFESHLASMAIARVRHEFDAQTWNVFELVWMQGRPPSEVALEMGRQPRWVYQAKYLVLKRLEEMVQLLSQDIAFIHR